MTNPVRLTLLFALILLCSAQGQGSPELRPGAPIARELRGGERHGYRVALKAGDFLQLVVDQQGIDVVAILLAPAPDSSTLAEVDSPNGRQGAEPISFIAERSGTYLLRVRSLEAAATPGRYEARIVALRPASDRDRQTIAVERALQDAERLRQQGTAVSLDRAAAAYRAALPLVRGLGDRPGEARALLVLGVIHLGLGRPDSAKPAFHSALAIQQQLGDQNGEGNTTHQLGRLFATTGNPDSALHYYHAAVAIWRRSGNRASEGRTLSNIGTVFSRMGNSDSAVRYLHAALALQRATGDRSGEGISLVTLGANFYQLNRLDSAISYMRSALTIQQELGDRVTQATTLGNLGSIFSALLQSDSAIVAYRGALRLQRELGDRRGEATSLNNLGFEFDAQRQADSALAYYGAALPLRRAVRDRDGESATLNNMAVILAKRGRADSAGTLYGRSLALAREVKADLAEAETLVNLALMYYGPVRNPGRAVAYFDSAWAVSTRVRRQSGDDPNRIAFTELAHRMYGGWALAALATGAGDAAQVALAAVERSRAQALLDLMRSNLEPATPGADLAAEGARHLAGLRNPHTAVVSYLLARDTLLTWVQYPTGELVVRRTAITPDSLESLIGSLRAGLGVDSAGAPMRSSGRASFETAQRALGGLLLPSEVQAGIPAGSEIVVIPHGNLALVPFAALPAIRGEPVGVRYGLRYAPSLAALGQAEARPGPETRYRGALVVGNPRMPAVQTNQGERLQLGSLPGAEAEARRTGAILESSVLLGEAASETEVRRRLATAPLVHLATHGLAFGTDARVRDSYVALSPDQRHDGFLTVGEILDDPELSLRADLVVLSACQTGLGDLRQAEGTVGFQRAFLARGARSLLVSQWSVSDRATGLLMEHFYAELGKPSVSKAEALRRAQDRVRRTPGYAHPRYWAAFQLVGAR